MATGPVAGAVLLGLRAYRSDPVPEPGLRRMGALPPAGTLRPARDARGRAHRQPPRTRCGSSRRPGNFSSLRLHDMGGHGHERESGG